MSLQRYSAVEMFGVPLDQGAVPDGPEGMIRLMEAYGIEGQDIPKESTDITPYYWRNPTFRYFLSLAHPEGPAVVEMLPRYADSETYLLSRVGKLTVGMELPEMRHLEIPGTQDSMAIIGSSPRFAGQLCIHELVNYQD